MADPIPTRPFAEELKMLLRSASLRLVLHASRCRQRSTVPLSMASAATAEEASAASAAQHSAMLTAGAMLCGYWAYGKATNGYAYVQHGAAATDQLMFASSHF